MHDTSTAGTPTPTNPDLDERVRDVLSHIFGEAHADGESDKLIASVTKQAASQHCEWSQPKAQDIPAADLRKMLSQRQRPDKPSVMINGVEYVAKLNDVMYQVSNHKKTTLPLALIDRGANGGVAGSDGDSPQCWPNQPPDWQFLVREDSGPARNHPDRPHNSLGL